MYARSCSRILRHHAVTLINKTLQPNVIHCVCRTNIKPGKNPCSGARVVICGRKDLPKLINDILQISVTNAEKDTSLLGMTPCSLVDRCRCIRGARGLLK